MTEIEQCCPFAAHAIDYYGKGWHPIPTSRSGTKKPLLAGSTGRDGQDHTLEELRVLVGKHPTANIGVRIPEGVIGIDIDQRDGKTGWDKLRKFQADNGLPDLPHSVMVTARSLPSGILLFKVPYGFIANDSAIGDVDILQRHHRFVSAPGSIHNGTGDPYRTLDPETGELVDFPYVNQLSPLDQGWLDALAKNVTPTEVREAITWDNPQADADQWGTAVQKWFTRHWTDKKDGGAHTALMAAVTALVRLDSLHNAGTGKAIERLRLEFVDLVTSRPPGSDRRTPKEAESEFQSGYLSAVNEIASTKSTAVEKSKAEQAAVDALLGPNKGATDPAHLSNPGPDQHQADNGAVLHLPPEFWASTERLAEVKECAHSQGVGADVFLYGVISRIAATTPPSVVLAPNNGGVISLNLCVGILGGSGTGKSSGMNAARNVIPQLPDGGVNFGNPASGQGMIEAYIGDKPIPENEQEAKGGKKSERGQIHRYGFFFVDEGEEFMARAGGDGATLMTTLRTMWDGNDGSTVNASKERTRQLDAHSYRWVFVAGFQEQKAAPLLAETSGGTMQRFLWVDVIDPAIPIEQTERREFTYAHPIKDDTLAWAEKLGTVRIVAGRRVGSPTFPEGVGDALYRASVLNRRGEATVTEEETHRPNLMAKTSALLAFLHGRVEISELDWELAETMVDVSVATQAAVKRRNAIKSESDDDHAAVKQGRREAITDAARADSTALRVAAVVGRRAHRDGDGVELTRKQLKGALRQDDRKSLGPAIDLALERGWIIRGADGKTKFRAGPERPPTT